MEITMQEKLIQFIHSLTDEECKMIVSALKGEQCDPPLPILTGDV